MAVVVYWPIHYGDPAAAAAAAAAAQATVSAPQAADSFRCDFRLATATTITSNLIQQILMGRPRLLLLLLHRSI